MMIIFSLCFYQTKIKILKMGAQQTQHFDPTIEGWEKVDMIGGITTWARQATG
jgi:hypothetical protein